MPERLDHHVAVTVVCCDLLDECVVAAVIGGAAESRRPVASVKIVQRMDGFLSKKRSEWAARASQRSGGRAVSYLASRLAVLRPSWRRLMFGAMEWCLWKVS